MIYILKLKHIVTLVIRRSFIDSDKWKSLYYEVEEKRRRCFKKGNSSYKNKKCGTVELYYFNGQPTNSLYRIDNKMIVV